MQASEVASTSDIESADSADAATISDAEPQAAADPPATDQGDSMAEQLRLLRAELEEKNGILDAIARKVQWFSGSVVRTVTQWFS